MGSDPGLRRHSGGLALGRSTLDDFERLLGERCGFRFNDVQRRTLEEAVLGRMAALGLPSAHEYLRLAREGSATRGELPELLGAFTNTETHFFRHDGRFVLLRERVLPALVSARPPGSTLRLLSAGCSTGEEVYSAIIASLEVADRWAGRKLEVVGLDVNPRALAQARRGRYGRYTLRFTPEPLLAGYFQPTDDRQTPWAVADRVRKHASFQQGNLLDPELPAAPGLGSFDVVFCCNVMIYFAEAAVEQLMDHLCAMVAPDGFLFVGYTESLHARRRDFEPSWSDDYVVYRKRPPPRRAVLAPAGGTGQPAAPGRRPGRAAPIAARPPSARRPPAATEPSGPTAPRSAAAVPDVEAARGYQQAVEHCRCDRQEQALDQVDAVLRLRPFDRRARLLKGYLLGSRGQFWPAVAECTKVLDIEPVCAQAYLLLGLLLEQQGEPDSAIREIRRALFLDPELPLGYFTLAKLLRSAGEQAAARRELDNTVRLLRSRADLPVAGDLPVEIDRAMLLGLAERQLASSGR